MKSMSFLPHAFAYVTLGLLCGWYYFLLLLFPTLIYFICYGSYIAGTILAIFIILSITPLSHEPWEPFMYSWLFRVWRDYFDFSYDCDTIQHGRMLADQRYMFFEFPHGGKVITLCFLIAWHFCITKGISWSVITFFSLASLTSLALLIIPWTTFLEEPSFHNILFIIFSWEHSSFPTLFLFFSVSHGPVFIW